MFKVGFIDYYLDEWHAENYPKWIEDISNGAFKVTCAYGDVEGTKFGRRTNQAFCDAHGIELLPTIEAVIEASDCLIVLSPDNPEEHPRLSELALKSGKPIYVDKTFANSKALAKEMFDLAKSSNTPMYSTSALRYAKAYEGLGGKANTVMSRGGGAPYNYLVHQLEPLVMLLGTDVQRGLAYGTKTHASFLLEFQSGKTASLSQHESFPFEMQVKTDDGDLFLEANDDFFSGMIKEMLKFFEAALEDPQVEPPVSRVETEAIMEAREILLEALDRPGEWVNRKEG